MTTISQLVWSIISKDAQALDYLCKGLLNTSAYAANILPKIQASTLSKVSQGSIITALARIKKNSQIKTNSIPKMKIDDISLRLPIFELVYRKNRDPNPDLSQIYQKLEGLESVHFNVINVENELDIFVSYSRLELVKKQMRSFDLLLEEKNLTAIILEYDAKFRNFPGMGSQILSCLAQNSINMIECITTYSKFIIYIKQDLANLAIEALKSEFM